MSDVVLECGICEMCQQIARLYRVIDPWYAKVLGLQVPREMCIVCLRCEIDEDANWLGLRQC